MVPGSIKSICSHGHIYGLVFSNEDRVVACTAIFIVFVEHPSITWCQNRDNNESTPTTEAAVIRGKCCRELETLDSAVQALSQPTGFDKKPAKVQCSTLLTVAGEEALEIFNTFGLTDEDKVKIDVVIRKFEEYCTPKKNVTYERHVFNTRAQRATEGIDAYVTELSKRARNCEFGELHNSIIRDRIVCGIRNNEVRKRLLREKDLNLEPAVEMCKSSEITENQAKNIVVDQDDREVHDVKDDSKKPPGKSRGARGKHKQTKKPFNCKRCGQVHQPQKCPAYGQVCHKCKQGNHY